MSFVNNPAKKMPEEFAARAADKLRYRYPQGESYEDVIQVRGDSVGPVSSCIPCSS
jgi:hypothetical protein